jgi:hypothetical protein
MAPLAAIECPVESGWKVRAPLPFSQDFPLDTDSMLANKLGRFFDSGFARHHSVIS